MTNTFEHYILILVLVTSTLVPGHTDVRKQKPMPVISQSSQLISIELSTGKQINKQTNNKKTSVGVSVQRCTVWFCSWYGKRPLWSVQFDTSLSDLDLQSSLQLFEKQNLLHSCSSLLLLLLSMWMKIIVLAWLIYWFVKLMLNLFHTTDVQRSQEYCRCFFVEYTIFVGLHSDVYKLIETKLDFDDRHLWTLGCDTSLNGLDFHARSWVTRKLKFVWSFCCRWDDIAQTFAMCVCVREITAKQSPKFGEYWAFEHLLLFLFCSAGWPAAMMSTVWLQSLSLDM